MGVDSEVLRQMADLQQRLTRAEEQLAAGDPRVTEALETAQQALSSAASAADIKKITDKLERDLQTLNSRVPKARSVPADDPEIPDPQNEPSSANAPGHQPTPPPPPPQQSSTSPEPPPAPTRRRRMH